jgi:aminobenzoyl-glutamate utilization protein B
MKRSPSLSLCLSLTLVLSSLTPVLSARNAFSQAPPSVAAATPDSPALAAMKQEATAGVASRAKMAQVMVDTVFSFSELGYHEVHTSAYLSGILEQNGFKVERGIAGIPTAFMATWGEGKPVIALGSDVDCIPQASQKPGVAYKDPIVVGAPGHGEGHNSGVPLNILAALAVKDIMQKNHMSGTIKVWPGIAEELLGAKAYYVRAGYFKDVDAVLFAHVGNNLGVSYGGFSTLGAVSMRFDFVGESSHASVAPWKGRSALSAVELMDVGWSFKRQFLRPVQRSHNVIVNGGDQPNVVPSTASNWYYFREADYAHVKDLVDMGEKMAEGAALMSSTKYTSTVLGSAWPGWMNKPIAEAEYENIQAVGLPQWSEADIALAKGIQHELKVPEVGLETTISPLRGGGTEQSFTGGPSDDIGDVSWNVPTIVLMYPSNIPNLPGHNWANSISMATPLAHKGVVAGAKAQAMTLLDLMTKPELLTAAWDYFNNVQTKNQKYVPFIRPTDQPHIELNKAIMDKYNPQLEKFYYDSAKYPTYLDQLGIKYPTLRTEPPSSAEADSPDSIEMPDVVAAAHAGGI